MVLHLMAVDALACGGFFCNNNEPVDQTGETIVFEVEDGTVTTHAMIQYEGTAADFAWVLPAPGIPEVFLSTEKLFDTLQAQSEPVLWLQRTWADDCASSYSYATTADYGYSYSSAGPEDGSTGVQVLATPHVGPYEGVILDAVDENALVTCLR